jgi:hypothetical protein
VLGAKANLEYHAAPLPRLGENLEEEKMTKILLITKFLIFVCFETLFIF